MAKNDLHYRISKIHTSKFSIVEYSDSEFEELFKKPEDLNFGLKTGIKFEENKKTVTIIVDSVLTHNKNATNSKTIVEHVGKTQYDFSGLDNVYDEKTDSYDLPEKLTLILFTLAYSHARALLSVELSPTPLKDKVFLPIIDNPAVLIPGYITKKED